MHFIIYLIFIYLSGFLYRKIFSKKLTYMLIPDDVISYRKKDSILKIHVVITFVISILLTQQLNIYIKIVSNINYDNFFVLLIFVYIFSLIIIGYIIDFLVVKFNANVSNFKTIIENPILFEEFDYLVTENKMNDEDFWFFLNESDSPVSPEEYICNLKNLSLQIEKYHPIKVVEFEKKLASLRSELLSEELFEYYIYIWGRKYEDGPYIEFIEFIIAQGKSKYEQIKSDPKNIINLDFDIYKLNKISISFVINEVYATLVGRLYPFKNDEKEIKIITSSEFKLEKIKFKSPNIFETFK